MTRLLCLVFFLSGAAALIFEILWFRLAGLVFGNSVWAASIVLSSFMGGLALGNALMAARGDQLKRPIRFYAGLEVVIAISGFFLVFLFLHLTRIFRPLFAPFQDQPPLLNAMRTIIAFILLLIPTTAMGATLPLLVKAINQRLRNFGQALGFLYGCNTLGAVLGVLLAEVHLIKHYGLIRTGMVAMSLNLFAAALAFGISRKVNEQPGIVAPTKTKPVTKLSPQARGLLAAGFFSGLAFLALEVVWFRFLILFFNALTLNFAIILATVLAAISLGGFLASVWLKKRSTVSLVWLFSISALLVVLSYSQFYRFYTWHPIYAQPVEAYRLIFASLFLVFPLSLSSGMIFTVIGRQLHFELGGDTKTAGLLTLFNTLGGMGGSFVTGFLLIPSFGMEVSFLLIGLVYAGMIALVIGLGRDSSKKERRWRLLPVPLVLIILALFPYRAMQRYLDLPVAFYNSSRGEVRVALREGFNETIQYLAKRFLNKARYFRLLTNGHSMSSTMAASKRYMQTFVYLPVALHPHPEKAALICFGCGMTAKALTDTKDLKTIDVVDISKDIVAMSSNIFPEPASNPINDPRVRLRIEDGRFFLGTTLEKYDIITGEPPPPRFRGVVNLYTQEYFQLIRDRLTDGGIVTYWLPVDMIAPDNAKSILRAFCNVFPNGTLWSASGYNWMMVGIKDPAPRVSEADFAAQWRDSALTDELHSLGLEKPEHLGAFFIADGKRLAEWIGSNPPATDDFPGRVSEGYDGATQREYLNYFNQFLDRGAMAANFRESRAITQLWPPDLAGRTAPYFANAQTMILDYPMTSLASMQILHKYLTDPLSTDYDIYALLNSDDSAQKIVTAALVENQQTPATMLDVLREKLGRVAQSQDQEQAMEILEICSQLSTRAIVGRDFLLAEKYFALLSSVSGGGMRKDFDHMRALLLYSAKENQQAIAILRQLRPTLTGSDASELDRYGEWLRSAFAP